MRYFADPNKSINKKLALLPQGSFRFIVDWDKGWNNNYLLEAALDEFKELLDKRFPDNGKILVMLQRSNPARYIEALAINRWGWKVEFLVPDPPPYNAEEGNPEKIKAIWRENYKRRDKVAFSLGIHHMIYFCENSFNDSTKHIKWQIGFIHGVLFKGYGQKYNRLTFIDGMSLLEMTLAEFNKVVPKLEDVQAEVDNDPK